MTNGPLRVGIGGPVGSGKTALMEHLCKRFRDTYEIAAITNDIYTKEDARILTASGALPAERIVGVETGGCPHTAIREDASINLAAIAQLKQSFPESRSHSRRIGRRQSRCDLLAANSPISRSMSSMFRAARRSRARAVRGSRARISW